MSFVNIRSELKSIIDAIKVAAGIATVYNYPPTTVGNTPAVAILDGRSDDSYGDTARNMVETQFIVRTMVEKTTDDSTQMTALLTVVDALLVELRKNTNATLNCQSHSILITSEPSDVASIGDVNVFYKDIVVTAQSLKTVV